MKAHLKIEGNQETLSVNPKARLRLLVRGYGNTIIIKSRDIKGTIAVYGCYNTIVIDEGCRMEAGATLTIGVSSLPAHHCTVTIGTESGLNPKTDLRLMEDYSEISIGTNCMIAEGCRLWCTDSHALLQDGKLMNLGRFIRIGNHCWLGLDCKVLKNVSLADGCTVGWGSILSKSCPTPNCVLAGVPARIVKEGVQWDPRRPKELTDKGPAYPDWDAGVDISCLRGRVCARLALALNAVRSFFSSRSKYAERCEKIRIALARREGK